MYSCEGHGDCKQDDHDECEYHDIRVKSSCHGAIEVLSKIAQGIADGAVAREVPTAAELKIGAEFEKAFWRGVEKRLEAESDRLKLLRRERDELLEVCEGLIAVVGLTAFKYEGQRAVLQDAVDIAMATCRKARNQGSTPLSSAIERLRMQGDRLLASLVQIPKEGSWHVIEAQ